MVTPGKKVRKRVIEKSFLPDEMITNILIRLPVKSVGRCGIVCRRWRDITLAGDFVDLHQKSRIPVILVTASFKKRLDLSAIDNWLDAARGRKTVNHRFPFRAVDFPSSSVLFSHAGLIVLRGYRYLHPRPKFIILNPVKPSDECLKINFSADFRGEICAVYYHPSLKEYCSLWKVDKSSRFYDVPEPIQCWLLNLGSNPSFKTICNLFDYRVKVENRYPLFINNHLYWMLKPEKECKYSGHNDILEFDIISEECKVIPCPLPLNTECEEHQTHLLNSDGLVSFLVILPSSVTIWRMKDNVEHLWTATEYTTMIDIYNDFNEVGIIAFVDGKLSFMSGGRLYYCNLKEGTLRTSSRKRCGDVFFLSHQMSMASLKNCRSTLYINRDGKVVV